MKRLLIAAFVLAAHTASAIEYGATPEAVWIRRFGEKPAFPVTERALREAIEWQVCGGPVPRIPSFTDYGLKLKRWERTIQRFGVAPVAEEYADFLRELMAELAKDKEKRAKRGNKK